MHRMILAGITLCTLANPLLGWTQDSILWHLPSDAKNLAPSWTTPLFDRQVQQHLNLLPDEREQLHQLFLHAYQSTQKPPAKKRVKLGPVTATQCQKLAMGKRIEHVLGKERSRRLRQIYWRKIPTRLDLYTKLLQGDASITDEFSKQQLNKIHAVHAAMKLRLQALKKQRERLASLKKSSSLIKPMPPRHGFTRPPTFPPTTPRQEINRLHEIEAINVIEGPIWNRFCALRGEPFARP